jgi:hypothetical protein
MNRFLRRALSRGPGVVLRSSLEIEHAGARPLHVALGALLVERIELEQALGWWSLGQLFDPALGGLKVFVERHDSHVTLTDSSLEPGKIALAFNVLSGGSIKGLQGAATQAAPGLNWKGFPDR